MSIRDRGKRRWAPAFEMPESRQFKNNLMKEYYGQTKPILDHFQVEEIENRICYAVEFNRTVAILSGKKDIHTNR